MSKRAENSNKESRQPSFGLVYALVLALFSQPLLALNSEWGADKSIQYSNIERLSFRQQTTIKQWIEFGVKASQNTLGLPYQKAYHFDIKPRYFATEPVPWARVVRGDLDSIELHVYRYASLTDLTQDWTLYHELAHLYHPLFDYVDFWLAEGLATYLQNIIMFQNGLINREAFYQRLRSGLSRGKINTHENIGKLSEISENMWELDAFQRVYWSGVAYFIEVENALKKQNKPNLISLIKHYQVCCRQSHNNTETGINFVKDLDRLSRSAIFSSHYFRYRNRTDFPVISSAKIRQLIQPKTLEN